jgi:hypothetical protein
MILIIRPLLRRGETVMGMRNQLIVRASSRTLREIKKLFEKIDTQLKNLRITVKQGTKSQLDELAVRVDAEIPIGETGRIIINSAGKGGVIVRVGRGLSVRARLLQKKFSSDEMDTQIVTTLEGKSAVIYFAQASPLNKRVLFAQAIESLNLNRRNLRMCVPGLRYCHIFAAIRLFWKFHRNDPE